MSRSIYKGPYVEASLIRKLKKLKEEGIDFAKTPIKTYSRRSQILPMFIGKIFEVYNGHRFIKVYVTESMIGHKLGEFSPTRIPAKHGDAKKQSAHKTIKKRK